MKAIAYDRFGGIGVLRLVDLPDPAPGPGEVVVAQHASSVNVIDSRVREGRMGILAGKRFPKLPGADVAGVVVARGAGVSGLAVGDRVFGAVDPMTGGAFAERVAVPAGQLAPLPPGLDMTVAAVLPVAGLAALTALRDLGRVTPGQRVLVHGGSGGVGLLAIAIARHLGAAVTAVSGAEGLPAMRAAGAMEAIDHRAPGAAAALAGPFDVILNLSGRMPWAEGRGRLTPAGRLVEPSPTIALVLGATLANLARRRKHLPLMTKPRRAALEELGRLAAGGALRPVIARSYPLAEAAAAFAEQEAGGVIGKLVVTIREG